MKQLSVDLGIEEYQLNDGGVLRFNPSDMNVYERFMQVIGEMEDMHVEMQQRAAVLDGADASGGSGMISLLREYDKKIKEKLNFVFGAENDFDAILRGVNMMSVAGNGKSVITNFMEALEPVVAAGAKRYLDQRAADASAQAKRNRAQRRAGATRPEAGSL